MYAGLYILHLPRSHDGLLVPGLHRVAVLLAIWVEVMTLVLWAFLAIRTYRDDTGNRKQTTKKQKEKNCISRKENRAGIQTLHLYRM